jgi:hypothetical protein
MATLEDLENAGALRRYIADLETWELPSRCISCAPSFDVWYANELKAAAKVRGRNLSPFDQVEQFFYDFIIGAPLVYSVDDRKLEPLGLHIWELKPLDVRIFGWVARKGHFIAVAGELKAKLVPSGLYKPFIEGVVNYRNSLPLDEPKSITGLQYSDVF